MTGDTTRHSNVFPKLENWPDRGAPGAKLNTRESCLGTKAGLPDTKAVPWHQARPSITVIQPQKDLQLETPPASGGKHSPRT